jgi:hypothetical protein
MAQSDTPSPAHLATLSHNTYRLHYAGGHDPILKRRCKNTAVLCRCVAQSSLLLAFQVTQIAAVTLSNITQPFDFVHSVIYITLKNDQCVTDDEVGRDSSVGIATGYGLDGPGI